jgi:hypothetical protein
MLTDRSRPSSSWDQDSRWAHVRRTLFSILLRCKIILLPYLKTPVTTEVPKHNQTCLKKSYDWLVTCLSRKMSLVLRIWETQRKITSHKQKLTNAGNNVKKKKNIVTWWIVTIDGFWVDGSNYCTLRYRMWLQFTVHYYTHTSVHSHVFTAVAW